MHASPLIISCVVLYLVGVLCVGLYLTKKKVKNSDDFAVANRSLPTIVLIARFSRRGAARAESRGRRT